MKKFHFRHQKIIHHYISLYKVYGYFKREVGDTFDRYLWHGYSKIPQEKRIAKIKEQMNEKIKINPPFCNYRVDSEQNVLDSAFYFIFDVGNPFVERVKSVDC